MAGQIIKRGDKTWCVRVFTGRDGNGNRRYMNKTIRGNKKDAETYLSTTLTNISGGTFIEPVKLTVEEYLDKWLATAAKARLRERTHDDYTEKLKRYIRPVIGKLKLSDVRPLDVQLIYTAMAERDLSPRTVRYTHAILSSALKQAVRWNMLARNPCEAVELPRMERKEMQALSPEEAGRFLANAKEDEYGALFAFALASGMRPEEYLALKWSDVDLEARSATVSRTLVWRKGGGWFFGEPKTTRSRRTVPFPEPIAKALKTHKLKQAETKLRLGASYAPESLVFCTSEGKPLNLRNLTQRHFKPILKHAELPESFRLYDLRHTCATLLLGANEHPKIVSERLGHASITLTLDTYSHVLPSMQQGASDKLERILFG
ncbi:MAG: site-specific integrase [Pyrinomonadaceae bacterium]|nr:site-specific integrase [Pyrinomonadaceae bacterium]